MQTMQINLNGPIIFGIVLSQPTKCLKNKLSPNAKGISNPTFRQSTNANESYRDQRCQNQRWPRHKIPRKHRSDPSHIEIISADGAFHPSLESRHIMEEAHFRKEFKDINPTI